jgi:hypothetical protein
MHIARLLVLVVVCMIGMSVSASAAICGDADNSGFVSIGDYARVIDHIAITGYPVDTAADCDNRAGITVGDLEALTRFLFYDDPSLDCSIAATYGFAPSLEDTVFLPYMTGIPGDLSTVTLQVMTSFAENTRGFYIPCRTYESEGPGRFKINSIESLNEYANFLGARLPYDTAIMVGTEIDETAISLTGRQTLFNLNFNRVQPGGASISCLDVVRTSTLRIAVEKGGDLYTPVVVYYEVPLPHPVVTVTPTPLAMESRSGRWSTGSYTVSLTADIRSASFKVTASDSWIAIDEPSTTVYTTPATITVRANASALDPGEYTGQITFTDIDPVDAEFVPAPLEVTLTVTEPITFPPGDINCDGKVTISDISMLIDCLFINTRPVPACE